MRTRRRLCSAALAVPIALATMLVPASAAAGHAATAPGWRVSRTFGPLSADGVTAAGSRNAWLAGLRPDCSVFVQHWNGSRWRRVPAPTAMFSDSGVIVGASSAADAWTFTYTRPAVANPYSVAWRWDGHGWRPFRFPDGSSVSATAVFSPADAWAFGWLGASTGTVTPYVARYDGKRWRRVHSPLLPTGASPISPDDIWTVGQADASLNTPWLSFDAARWNGSSWRVLRLPSVRVPKGSSVYAPGILALGSRDIWIDFRLRSTRQLAPEYGAVVLHFNGTAWTQVRVPYKAMTDILGMTPDGRGGIWFAANIRTLPGVVMYDNRNGRWSRHAVPAKRGSYASLNAVATRPDSTTAWAAGSTGSASGGHVDAVLYEYDG